jgi:hypothetical protein
MSGAHHSITRLAGHSGGDGAPIVTAILLSAWLGAAIFFAAAVAPAAFRVLPTRSQAGALVGRTLPVIFVAGVAIGLGCAVLTLREPAGSAVGRSVRWATELGIAVLCAVGQFVIGGRIERLRAGLGTTLDALPPGHPARAAFGRWHALSVAALGAAMLLAVVALAMARRAATASTTASEGTPSARTTDRRHVP